MRFPEISNAELLASADRAHGLIVDVTVRNIQFIHRLGCKCGRWVGDGCEYAFIHKGEIIREGVDFCLLESFYEY